MKLFLLSQLLAKNARGMTNHSLNVAALPIAGLAHGLSLQRNQRLVRLVDPQHRLVPLAGPIGYLVVALSPLPAREGVGVGTGCARAALPYRAASGAKI